MTPESVTVLGPISTTTKMVQSYPASGAGRKGLKGRSMESATHKI
jgi:hypothetical protein